jgi:hypothetical protein
MPQLYRLRRPPSLGITHLRAGIPMLSYVAAFHDRSKFPYQHVPFFFVEGQAEAFVYGVGILEVRTS